ncbi:MAG: phytoene/squalene synthase family protein [Acidobacteriota bacterium]|nr:phytoene/squalene synthase family protein [Acidobacteriota bacterium]
MSVEKQLDHAYAICRGVTRSSAKNFFYAFLVMPKEKRNALCAVYAFMRHADDLSDDVTMPVEQRAQKLAAWSQQFHQAMQGQPTDDPVLFALADAQQRFHIPVQLFDQLVEGTMMDLQQAVPGVPLTFRTFDDLSRYCYHVASVVGLISIRIFGYKDPAAEPLAERTGIAFQLTNIIRDVREDALMGRVYLPQDDLARFGRSTAELAPAMLGNGFQAAVWADVLRFEADRAREFYRAADELIPLINEDCQPALWTLVTIYSRLLDKIALKQYDVFRERVRLTVPEKLKILGMGFVRQLA